VKKSKLLLTIIAIVVLGLGWYLLSEKSVPDSPESTKVYSDSVPEAERPVFTAREDTVQKDSIPPRAGEELAPGTALVKATVIADESDSKLTVTFEEVLRHGSSTSPIAAPQEMTISVERYLKSNPGDKKILKEGKTVFMVVSSEEGMSLGESQGNKKWSLVEIKTQ